MSLHIHPSVSIQLNGLNPLFPHRQKNAHDTSKARAKQAAEISKSKKRHTIGPKDQNVLHGKSLCTEKLFTNSTLLHRSFTHSNFCTEKLLHRASFFTEKLLHTEALTQRRFYTEKAFAQRSFYTEQAFSQKNFYTQKLLHRDAFTQRKLLHREAFYTQQAITQRSC